jgi:hypothetical protein
MIFLAPPLGVTIHDGPAPMIAHCLVAPIGAELYDAFGKGIAFFLCSNEELTCLSLCQIYVEFVLVSIHHGVTPRQNSDD